MKKSAKTSSPKATYQDRSQSEEVRQDLFAAGSIQIKGARVHNLKNIDVEIPRHKLSVVTGLSGSGKSSLVFDVLLAEGQRRYIDTFSAYARSFIGSSSRPDVESIDGLSPVVSIEQKTASNNPRSTVGTITEIYDFLRLLYARVGTPYSYVTGKAMQRYSEPELIEFIAKNYAGKGIEILAPLVKDRKGHYRELFEELRKKGFIHVYADGEILELYPGLKLDRYSRHYIAVLIDKFVVKPDLKDRLAHAITLALKHGDGLIDIHERGKEALQHLSTKLMDIDSGIAYPEISPASFSFNSPQGYCPTCRGLGQVSSIDRKKILPDPKLSIQKGGIKPLTPYAVKYYGDALKRILAPYELDLDTPIGEIPDDAMETLLYGEVSEGHNERFEGVINAIIMEANKDGASDLTRQWAEQFLVMATCPTCQGKRLNTIALHYRIGEWSIDQLSAMDLDELHALLPRLYEAIPLQMQPVGREIIKEIEVRIRFLLDVGLYYLSLGRSATSLSGGESQRIRLATQIGTGLVEVLYLLDEPGIGLHPSDNQRLIRSLKKLRDGENTVVVVEHDRDMMLAADYLIDMGPGAGRLGGQVVFAGAPDQIAHAHSYTADYLNGIKRIEVPNERRRGNGKTIQVLGAKGNNLKGVNLTIPLGTFICVTGVSGSGKSSLINGTLVPILSQKLYHSKQNPLPYRSIEGIKNIDKLVVVDQTPLGRTPRSNPATYTGLFTDIRNIFVSLPESKARGYKPGRFSFNIAGGRCETCKGNGYTTLEMNFLPNVTIPCEVCHGKRYSRETLEVRYKGKTIADVLEMTINQATDFFENIPRLHRRLEVMKRVGLGYIKLGQPSTTLSGGESQRVKLSEELTKRDTGNTLYVLDEPTTGLHFEDVRVLLSLVNQLVDKGNTVLIIEHDLDVIKSADYLIEMGPEGGRGGGELLFAGTPEEMVTQYPNGKTSPFLAPLLQQGIQ